MRRTYLLTSRIRLILFLALIVLVLFLIQIATVQATPETIVKVDPHTGSANVGETFTFNITIVDVQNLYGVEVTLYWNSSLLKPVNIDIRLGQTDGVLYNPIYIVENSTREGEYVLAAMSYAPAPSFNGSGNIVRITFNATNSGDSKLDLETLLWDYPPPDREPHESLPIEHTTVDGFFNIIPEFPNTIILTVFMILITLAVILYKKTPKKTSLHLLLHSQHFQLTFISIGKVTK